MVKISSSDALAILRRFGVAGDEHVPRHIERLTISHPSATNTLASFRFLQNGYYILFDDRAEDRADYIEAELRTDKQDLHGTLLVNPHSTHSTYGLPFKGKDVYLFAAESPFSRLDSELARRYPDISRSTWQKYIKAGYVSIGGATQTSAKAPVSEHTAIALDIPEKADFSGSALPIIHLDDDVIVIDKPTGVLTHSKGVMNDEFTVADFFRRYTSVGLETNRPGIVHRLDRDTSGILIGARTEDAFALLKQQFADRKAKKHYVAIVTGAPSLTEATIDVPIGRNPSAPSTFRADPSGKPAQTDYRVIASSGTHSLVELWPKTGRTHQLRVHLQYIGAPILGDSVYGTESADRLYLHAESLEITTPGGVRATFTSPLPKAFSQVMAQ